MALLKKSARQALDKSRHELAAIEATIGSLYQDRQTVLTDDSAEVDALVVIDNRLVSERKKLIALQDRIAVLEQKAEREQADRQRKDYAAKVSKLESGISALEAPAKEVASAFRSFANSIEKLAAAQSEFIRSHPPGFLLPGQRVSLDRVQRAISAAFQGFEDRADRLAHIREVAGNFLDAELRDYADHIAALKVDMPQVETEQDQAA